MLNKAKSYPVQVLAITLSLAVLLVLVASTGWFLNLTTAWLATGLVFIAGATALLLGRLCWRLRVTGGLDRPGALSRGQWRWMCVHSVLHLVPLVYVWLGLKRINVIEAGAEPTNMLLINTGFYPVVALFFFSGRQVWQTLGARYEQKIYRIFFMGNSGMLLMHTVFLILGLLINPMFGAVYFTRILLFYVAVHFLILGPAVMKIERDSLQNNQV